MSVILVHDYDFFHYPSVIPNLECAKYVAYQREKKKNIVVFHHNLNPEMYSHTFVRKDYDDGIFDEKLLLPSVEYGGRAFSKNYKSPDLAMESINPDFSIYQKYGDYFGHTYRQKETLRTILNATNVRLSIDGIKLNEFPYERLQKRHPNIIFHDYDISTVPDAYDLLHDLNDTYRIGNKFPINTYNKEELQRWFSLKPMTSTFYLQYNNFLTEDEFIEIFDNPNMKSTQFIYNFIPAFQNENDFLMNGLSDFYKQILFLRRIHQQILLNVDTNFFQTPELATLIRMLNCFCNWGQKDNVLAQRQTLYGFCAWKKRDEIDMLTQARRYIITKQEMRDAFQYVRQHNYEVFDLFYSMPGVIIKGGKLINEWTRDTSEN